MGFETDGGDGPRHGIATLDGGVRIHHVSLGDGPRPILLIHGFPQSWWEWRDVMPILASTGCRVIAMDYRGAGNSSKPAGGYDKWTMAGDLNAVLTEHLGIDGPVAVVGHDIGGMVAGAYAARFRATTSHLALIDTCVPGTDAFAALRAHPRPWHLRFHAVPDLPELLVHGRERPYLRYIMEALIADPSRFTGDVMDVYCRLYEAPGAMRAGFDLYRSFDRDDADIRQDRAANGRLSIPILAMAGGLSPLRLGMVEMARELGDTVSSHEVPGTGHWLAEERPDQTAAALLHFLGSG